MLSVEKPRVKTLPQLSFGLSLTDVRMISKFAIWDWYCSSWCETDMKYQIHISSKKNSSAFLLDAFTLRPPFFIDALGVWTKRVRLSNQARFDVSAENSSYLRPPARRTHLNMWTRLQEISDASTALPGRVHSLWWTRPPRPKCMWTRLSTANRLIGV